MMSGRMLIRPNRPVQAGKGSLLKQRWGVSLRWPASLRKLSEPYVMRACTVVTLGSCPDRAAPSAVNEAALPLVDEDVRDDGALARPRFAAHLRVAGIQVLEFGLARR